MLTGQGEQGEGDEDLACLEYIETLLRCGLPDPGAVVRLVSEILGCDKQPQLQASKKRYNVMSTRPGAHRCRDLS